MNILVTSTSFQDTPGSHINLLNKMCQCIDKIKLMIKFSHWAFNK